MLAHYIRKNHNLLLQRPYLSIRHQARIRFIHVRPVQAGKSEDNTTYEAGMYVDKVFPLKLAAMDFRQYIWAQNKAAMERKVAQLIPDNLPHQFTVSKIEPHARDGGSLVYFTFAGSPNTQNHQAENIAQELVDLVDGEFAAGRGRVWYDLVPIRSLAVRGLPFMEDIVRMLPSKKVKVEFNGPSLTIEQLYHEFREFGRIRDIEMQPSSNKDMPHWAIIHFTEIRGATRARNCVYGHTVESTKLIVSYVKESHHNVAIQWLKEHSKFTIPLAAAALIAAIYAVFDPIREFFVENKITHRFDLSRIPLIGDVRRAAMRSLLKREPVTTDEEVAAWSSLGDERERLTSILDEPPESFIVVAGPHGSGKTKLTEQAIQNKKYRVVIDANNLASQHSELEQMTLLAKQLGWWPVFNSIIGITNTIDLMVTATTGSNAGVSATPESQVRKILECLALVLNKIRHSGLDARKLDSENKEAVALPPNDVPVIVLENFMDKDLAFTNVILEWAASVIEAGLAHCIITTTGISGYHEVQRVQPQRATSLISLDDASPMGAISLLQQQLAPKIQEAEGMAEHQRQLDVATSDQMAHAASVLGGRLEDLQVFVQKVRAGESIEAALEDLIQRSITEVRKYAFANDSEVGQCEHTWTPEQFWYLLTELAQHESVEYDRMRNSSSFAGNDDALLGLAEAQLITMVYDNDRPSRIRAGRPVYYAAFNRILEDPGFSSTMTMKMNKTFIEQETAKIRKAEEELSLLNVFRASSDFYNTRAWSMATLASTNNGNPQFDRKKRGGSGGGSHGADPLMPEAYIPSSFDSSSANNTSSWFGWLFDWGSSRASRNQQHLQRSDGNADSLKRRRTIIPGIPGELQGRVQYLLQIIHTSQQKIDKWDAENKAKAQCLAEL